MKRRERIKAIKQKTSAGAKAGFTIEAAVIIPIIMLITLILIFLSFYMHDRVILSSVSVSSVMENIDMYEDRLDAITGEVSEMLSKRLIIIKNVSVETSGSSKGYEISSKGDFHLPFGIMNDYLEEEITSAGTQINITNLKGRETLIKYKALADGAEALVKEE